VNSSNAAHARGPAIHEQRNRQRLGGLPAPPCPRGNGFPVPWANDMEWSVLVHYTLGGYSKETLWPTEGIHRRIAETQVAS
jgi:hypothetical protein